ncbi:MAG: class I adenylate cyclase [Gammaproteobacteria bacterium]|nr:class I adenylate cyclase [Gammaproteobacteria bacterium]
MQFSPKINNINHDVFLSKQHETHTLNMLEQLSVANNLIFKLLPLFLCINHPKLPGYLINYRLGKIDQYDDNAEVQDLVKQLFNVENYQLLPEISIDGIYTIGSVGSIGQSKKSDWDIWVCLPESLTEDQKLQLTQKCQGIEHWAQQIGAELHLFLVTQNQFKHGTQNQLDNESSGSAQHWLLLDEFYRSAIAIAGKPILWRALSPVPIETDNYIDFGDIPAPPAQEYFGAMLWQLYKGIDSPEKSLLKALLLESYFRDFPNSVLLSQQWKSNASAQFIDHYTLLLNRISAHLTKLGDPERLELVRECFYLKCTPNLSYLGQNSSPNYQQLQFQELVKQWQFSPSKIRHLDCAARWSPVAAQNHHQRLVAALLKSYHLLKEMAQRHHVNEALNRQEMAILSRKLYCAYQSSATKITRLPTNALSIHTKTSLYFRRALSPQNEKTWLLLDQPPVFGKDCTIAQDKNLIKLLGWAAINNYCASNSKIQLPGDISQWAPKMERTLALLSSVFGQTTKATKNALVQASQVDQIVLVLNMREDATTKFNGQALMMNWIKSNIFSIGSDKYSLVSSIDLVYRNSWQEHHCIEFTGDRSILECISFLFSLISSASSAPKIKIECVGKHQRVLLSDKVLFLFKECLTIRKKSTKKGIKVKSLVVAGKLYGLFFHPERVEYQAINSALDLYKKLNDNSLTLIPNNQGLNQQQNPSKLAQIITEHASSGYVQFFLEQLDDGIGVYVLDENNHLSNYHQDDQNEIELIKSIYRFYTFTKDQQNISQEKLDISFNLPQFSRITYTGNFINIEPFDQHSEDLF